MYMYVYIDIYIYIHIYIRVIPFHLLGPCVSLCAGVRRRAEPPRGMECSGSHHGGGDVHLAADAAQRVRRRHTALGYAT